MIHFVNGGMGGRTVVDSSRLVNSVNNSPIRSRIDIFETVFELQSSAVRYRSGGTDALLNFHIARFLILVNAGIYNPPLFPRPIF